MSELIESIKQGANQILSSIDQQGQLKSAVEGIRSQWTEVERRRKANALRSQVKTLQNEMRQLTEALGLQTLSLFDAGKIALPELARLCERINELRSEIDQAKKELDDLQASATPTQCPKCQTIVPADAEFCPKCGATVAEKKAQQPAAAVPQTRTAVRFRCPKCKTTLSPDADFCPNCGVKLKRPSAQPAPKQFCPSCGAQTGANAQFCPICGQSISSAH